MSITARHKKPGGFRKLVNALETTGPKKRAQILEAMKAEDPGFVEEVEGRLFKFEEFKKLPDLVICEIVGAMAAEMKAVAMALQEYPDAELVEKFTKNMPTDQMRDYRDALEEMGQANPAQRMAAQFRMITRARELEEQGKLSLKKYSEKYFD